MSEQEVLAQLKDIHLPKAISWWPLAPGWYGLLLLSLLGLFAVCYWLYKRHQYAKPKKQALQLLANYQREYERLHNSQTASARISELLRRVALVYYPRVEVASLHGAAWLEFLNKTSKGINFQAVQELLLDSPFKNEEQVDLKPLFVRAQKWIKQRGKPCLN